MKRFSWGMFALTFAVTIQPLAAQVQGQWAPTGTMQDGRELGAQVLLKTGSVLSMGGVDNSNNVLASAEVYSAASGKWNVTGSMAEARAAPRKPSRLRAPAPPTP